MSEQEDRTERELIEWLGRNEASCPICAYELYKLSSGTCPECGAELHLTVGTRDLRLGAWIVALISFTLALGFDGVISLVAVVAMFQIGAPPADVLVVLAGFVLLAILSATGLGVLLSRRRQWLRLSRRRQWLLARVIFLIVFVVHALFGLLIGPL